MGEQKNNGFTIIEVTLVLAISSLLLLLMMTGVTLAVQRQRFSDSVNGSQNIINDRTTGVCGDPANPGATAVPDTSTRGASGCEILGKLIDIQQASGSQESTISSYDVIAENVDPDVPPYDTMSDIALITSIKPTVIRSPQSDINYIVPWGAQISNIRDATTVLNGTPIEDIALLRSPRTGIIHVYEINPSPIPSLSDPSLASHSITLVPASIQEITNGSVKMCINSVDLITDSALLQITPTGSQDGIVTDFDGSAKAAYQCP
jgi:prepilin-type N-terminal cleavage/methylation domain-containing protein